MSPEGISRPDGVTVPLAQIERLVESDVLGIVTGTGEVVVDANDAFLALVGYTRDDLQAGRINWRAMTPPEYAPLDDQSFEELRTRGRCTAFEKAYLRKDGSRVPVLVGAIALDPDVRTWICFVLDLTERHQAEAALRASEERFEAFMAHLPATAYIKDAQGRYLFVNRLVETVTGRPVAEVVGRTDAAIHPRDVAAQLRANDLAVLERGERVEVEETVFVGDRPHTFLSFKFPVPGPTGEPLVGGISIDVTERKRIESVLRESEERYRVLTESIPQLVWATTPEGRASYFNRRSAEYTGVPEAELIGTGWWRVVHPDDLDRVERAWKESLDTGLPYRHECRIRRADGAYRWHLMLAVPLRDPGGPTRAWLGTSTDIDDQKRAEETERFMAEASTLLAASLDTEATLAQVARLALPWFADWTAVDLLRADGSLHRVTVAHRDPAGADLARRLEAYAPRPESEHDVWRVIRSGQARLMTEVPESFLAERVQDDEHRRVAYALGIRSFISVPLLVRGRAIGVLSFVYGDSGRRYGPADLRVAEDLAARAALAIDNARLYREAQEAAHARDVFLARASHELRTPLTSVLASVRLLRNTLGGRAAHAPVELVEMASRNLAAILALLDDLLDASKLTAGAAPLALEPVPFADVVLAAKEAVEPQASEKGVTLRSVVPQGLVLEADPLKLLQVLTNLLGNAVKFTPGGGEVAVEVRTDEGEVVILVRDTGEGVASEHLSRIFEPFNQVARKGRAGPRGTGLGLAICRQIVTLHGGRIWAESKGLGTGTTVVVVLPRRVTRERAA